MSEPDVISDGRGPRRGVGAVGVVVLVAIVVAFLVRMADGSSHDAALPPTMSSPGPPASTVSVARGFPNIIARSGDALFRVTPAYVTQIGTLPFQATDVWVTTAGGFSPGESSVRVFGVAGGNAFRLEIGPTGTSRDDLGPASGVLLADEAPVLVSDGERVTVSDPQSREAATLPAGWQPAGFENLGYAGILTRDVDAAGEVDIASWSPGGDPQVLGSGLLLGVTDGGQAVWLDASCPAGPGCALFFGDIGGLHPRGGVRAPSGVQFSRSPIAYGTGSYLVVAAVRTGDSTAALVVVDPWRGTARVVPDSQGVDVGAGFLWADSHDLAFVIEDPVGGERLAFYDVDSDATTAFGPRLTKGSKLLTAYGATDSVRG